MSTFSPTRIENKDNIRWSKPGEISTQKGMALWRCNDLPLLYKRGGVRLFDGWMFWKDEVLPDRALQTLAFLIFVPIVVL